MSKKKERTNNIYRIERLDEPCVQGEQHPTRPLAGGRP